MQRHWLHLVWAGFLIGITCILPGASGGVLAMALGLYRPMLDAALHFFQAPKRHLPFLLPLGAGIAVGIVLGAAGLSGAMARYERLMLFLFTGLIAGGIPDLLQEAHQNQPFRPSWLFSLAAGVLIALPLCLPAAPQAASERLTGFQAFACGLLEGVGTVIPGISSSFVLLRLGWYQAYLQLLAAMDLPMIAAVAGGFALSATASMHAAQRFFDRYPPHAYYAVLGFLLVSVILVFPGFTLGRETWAQLAMLAAGTALVRLMSSLRAAV